MKTRKYKIQIDIYESTLYLVLTKDIQKAEKSLLKSKNWKNDEPDEPQTAVFWYSDSEPGEYHILFNTNPDDRTVVHESLHATFTILRHHGVLLSDSSEEAFSYLMDYIFGKIKEKIK